MDFFTELLLHSPYTYLIINDLDKYKLSKADIKNLEKSIKKTRYYDRWIYFFEPTENAIAKDIFSNIDKNKNSELKTFFRLLK